MNSTEKLIAELWDPPTVRQMAYEFADVAADKLAREGEKGWIPKLRRGWLCFCFQRRGRRNDRHSDRFHWKLKEALSESGFGYAQRCLAAGACYAWSS